MSKVKTQTIAAGVPLVDAPEPAAQVEPPEPTSAMPEQTTVPSPATAPPAPTPTPLQPLPEIKPITTVLAPAPVSDPQRPGLETPATPAVDPNPFTVLNRWAQGTTHGTLRAMEVPGGCLVKSAYAIPGHMGEALCFVPGVVISEGRLYPAPPAK